AASSVPAKAGGRSEGADSPFAPKGRQEISQGQGPWNVEQVNLAPRRGARNAFPSPLRGERGGSLSFPGALPLANSLPPLRGESRFAALVSGNSLRAPA